MDDVNVEFGLQNFANYRRLSYKWWYALAEFIDNSTQSYYDNREELDKMLERTSEEFEVEITTGDDFIRIYDNAMGMNHEDLSRALVVGVPPQDATGRSKYGMGMKTAACWIGNSWIITTSKLGSPERLTISVDVNNIAGGNPSVPVITEEEGIDSHYTRIDITKHNRHLMGRTIGKVKEYLESIYRKDISAGDMTLKFNGAHLEWKGFSQEDFLERRDGSRYRKDIIFEVDTEREKKVVEGWVGVLKDGSRKKAGFSILHKGRLIRGWPDSWRPEAIFGAGGRNDLINQRLVGEINLEEFEVSHTKDEINWFRDEEETVEKGLKKACALYIEGARTARKGVPPEGPTPFMVDAAVRTLEEELSSPEFIAQLNFETVLPSEKSVNLANLSVLTSASAGEPTFSVSVKDMLVKVYIDPNVSQNDPYYLNDSKDGDEVLVVVNQNHPHWQMLEGQNAILNFLRHCVYDAIAEHRAIKQQRLNSDTIKLLKDKYLRVPFEIIESKEE